jgi:hypothetical protein
MKIKHYHESLLKIQLRRRINNELLHRKQRIYSEASPQKEYIG